MKTDRQTHGTHAVHFIKIIYELQLQVSDGIEMSKSQLTTTLATRLQHRINANEQPPKGKDRETMWQTTMHRHLMIVICIFECV